MTSGNKLILATNASLIFVATAIWEMTLHEGGHFLAGLLTHTTPTLYHNYVMNNSDAATTEQKIFFAAAGPVVSLLIGVICQLWLRGRKQNVASLFILYMSVFGYIGFFGYMGVAPFFSYGDTGYVLRAWGAPMWLIIMLAVIAAAILFLVLRALATYFVSYMNAATAANGKERGSFIFLLVTIPAMIGIGITALLNLPSPSFLSLLAPICSPFSLFWVYHYYMASPAAATMGHDEEEGITKKIPLPLIAITIVIVVINRLLVYGFSF